MENEFLDFEESQSSTGLTKIVTIFSKIGKYKLGKIRWHSNWRKYCFFPENETVFDRACLEVINTKLYELMEERKK